MGCCFLLQGIFLTQGSNPCLLNWQTGSLALSHQETPIVKLVPIANLWLLWINESSSDMDVPGSSLSYKQRKLGLHLLVSQVTDFFAESNSGFPIGGNIPSRFFVLFESKQLETHHPLIFIIDITWNYTGGGKPWPAACFCKVLLALSHANLCTY